MKKMFLLDALRKVRGDEKAYKLVGRIYKVRQLYSLYAIKQHSKCGVVLQDTPFSGVGLQVQKMYVEKLKPEVNAILNEYEKLDGNGQVYVDKHVNDLIDKAEKFIIEHNREGYYVKQ